jgi:two-component system nitrate/nitrite response regulator NarL
LELFGTVWKILDRSYSVPDTGRSKFAKNLSGAEMQTHSAEGVVALQALRSPVPGPANIRVAIASPVHLAREGLAASLLGRRGVALVGNVDLDPRGMARIADTKPDVVLVDLGQTAPAAAARLVKEASPGCKLVAFALDETGDQVFACAAAGFSGYVPRQSGAEELHGALVDAMAGRMHCAPHIAAAMFSRLAGLLHEPDAPASLPPLSSRENEILALVAQGHSNKQVARQLAISAATVKNHMHNILQKLQVTRRGEAAARLRAHHAG